MEIDSEEEEGLEVGSERLVWVLVAEEEEKDGSLEVGTLDVCPQLNSKKDAAIRGINLFGFIKTP